ncbi:MAG: sigma-70 family RNA polymerase sigma factor [Isosphaeraceae bacterium]
MSAVGSNGSGKPRRSYQPTVEALEALKLLSSATHSLPDLTIEHDVFGGLATPTLSPVHPSVAETDAAWDEVLTQTRLSDILGRSLPSTRPADVEKVESGLVQLNKYLSRSWYRAGIAPQAHDDCTQAVFVTLLQTLGRDRFDHLLEDIGDHGIRDVLSRETAEGPDFFRAIDTVKKRAQRERTYQPLDAIDVVSDSSSGHDARGALQEVIENNLTPREAALVYQTLLGRTPAEIAQEWGVAPKTVSNEKTRVIQKLRDALGVDELD